MERYKENRGEEKSESANTRFSDLLSNFSYYVNKEASVNGFSKEEKCCEDLLLETVFPKNMNQPLEKYLCISPALRLESFFECLHPFDIVVGKVTSIIGSHVCVVLLYMLDGQRRFISDLNVVSVVDADASNEEEIKVGDNVKGVVTHVERNERKVEISFQEKLLGDDQIRHFPLGKIITEYEDDEICDNIVNDESELADPLAYIRDLERSSDFVDPHSIKRLLNQLKLSEQSATFLGNSFGVSLCESAEVMREKQSFKWSLDMVGCGVRHLREQRVKEAMKCFDQSISFYPKNVEAYVARGALKANHSNLKEAVEDFREALQLNPKHRNATKYLIETLTNIAKRYEKDMKWKEASRYYKDILDVDSENKDALKQYNQIKQILVPKSVEKKDVGETSPEKRKTLSVKSKERINRLKMLLQAETKRGDDDYNSSTTTSTSTSSDSDSSSSDEHWVEKPNIESRQPSGEREKKRRKQSPERGRVT